MRVSDLVRAMESLAPTRFAEPWDNVGLLVGDLDATLERVLLTVDYTRAVADEVRAKGCTAVVAYHPVIFEGIKKLRAGSEVYEAVRDGIAIYSPHTALDCADGGTNDVLADALDLTDRVPLKRSTENERIGIGRIGRVERVERSELIERVKSRLGLASVLVAGPTNGTLERAAACAGACGPEFLGAAIAQQAGLYLTGELRHHDALRAAREGMTVVCTLHSNSERATLPRLAERLAASLERVTFSVSERDRDPFSLA